MIIVKRSSKTRKYSMSITYVKQERPFTCDHCEEKFEDKKELQRHATKHRRDEPAEAGRAGRGGTERQSCDKFQEIFNIHHLCDHCEEEFEDRKELQRHATKHRRDEPAEAEPSGRVLGEQIRESHSSKIMGLDSHFNMKKRTVTMQE